MDVILYKYSCPRWFGTYNGIKNIAIDEDIKKGDLTKELEKIENRKTGSKTCKVELLQKYTLSIQNIENYAGIATIPVNINNKAFEENKIVS